MDNNHIDANRRWLSLSKEEFEDILKLIEETKIKELTFTGSAFSDSIEYDDFSDGKIWPESCVMKIESDSDSKATKIYMIRADFLVEVHLLIDEMEKNAINALNAAKCL